MKRSGLAVFLLLGTFILSCSATVGVGHDRDFHFQGYRTYRWVPERERSERERQEEQREREHREREHHEGERHDDPVNLNDVQSNERIQLAIEREMHSKGYVFAPNGPADLEIIYHLGENGAINTEDHGYHWWQSGGKDAMKTYKEGTLIIDVINPKNNQIVWRGSLEGAINKSKENQELIDFSVYRILKEFPRYR